MKPPSSDAEALRDQQAAQVRATNGLFMTPHEFRHLECGQQTIRQSFVQRRRLRHLADHVRSMRRFRVRDAGHGHPPHICGAERGFERQTVDERLEPGGPQRVMDLKPIVCGGNRDWQQNLRRNQVLGSLSYFKTRHSGQERFDKQVRMVRARRAVIARQRPATG